MELGRVLKVFGATFILVEACDYWEKEFPINVIVFLIEIALVQVALRLDDWLKGKEEEAGEK